MCGPNFGRAGSNLERDRSLSRGGGRPDVPQRARYDAIYDHPQRPKQILEPYGRVDAPTYHLEDSGVQQAHP